LDDAGNEKVWIRAGMREIVLKCIGAFSVLETGLQKFSAAVVASFRFGIERRRGGAASRSK